MFLCLGFSLILSRCRSSYSLLTGCCIINAPMLRNSNVSEYPEERYLLSFTTLSWIRRRLWGKNLEDSEDLNKFAYCQVVGGTCPLESSYLILLRQSSQVAVVHVCRSVETKEYDNLWWSYKVGDGNESVEIVNLCSWIALGMRCFIKRRRRKHWRHSISRQYWF